MTVSSIQQDKYQADKLTLVQDLDDTFSQKQLFRRVSQNHQLEQSSATQ